MGSGGRSITSIDADWPAEVIRPFQNLTDDLKTYEAMLRYYAFIADFTNRGRGLVEQYIKFDDILEYKTTLANFSSSLAEMRYSLMIRQIWSQKVFSDII